MWLKRLGVTQLRTGLSWADSFRPDADRWFDRMMHALEPFEVTVTFCFTPEHRGLAPHHTSPPLVDEEFAEFCARMLRRYWRVVAIDSPRASFAARAPRTRSEATSASNWATEPRTFVRSRPDAVDVSTWSA